MKAFLAVVDYGMGNLHSVSKALEKAGARVRVTDSPALIRRADGVVLPGVGAFGEAVQRLSEKKLAPPVMEALRDNKPFLGICLGLQMLFERSEESPRANGLGFFKGAVRRFRAPKDSTLKIPHMGWNTVSPGPASKARALRGVGGATYFYFVHSFFAAPEDQSLVATQTSYGKPFCSSVAKGRLFASQFHPEKSGDSGHRLLRHFVQEAASCR